MADAALRARPAFAELLHAAGAMPAGIAVVERLGLGLASFQARAGAGPELRARVEERHGILLPDGPRRASKDGVSFVGTGPGAWLALGEGAGNGLATALAEALRGLASVADQSDGYAVLRLSGARVPDLLAKGMSLDLHPRAFRVGDAAVTSLAHVGAIMWRLADEGGPVFEVAVFRSFAGSLAHWLEASAAEYGLAVGHAA